MSEADQRSERLSDEEGYEASESRVVDQSRSPDSLLPL